MCVYIWLSISKQLTFCRSFAIVRYIKITGSMLGMEREKKGSNDAGFSNKLSRTSRMGSVRVLGIWANFGGHGVKQQYFYKA